MTIDDITDEIARRLTQLEKDYKKLSEIGLISSNQDVRIALLDLWLWIERHGK